MVSFLLEARFVIASGTTPKLTLPAVSVEDLTLVTGGIINADHVTATIMSVLREEYPGRYGLVGRKRR